MAWGTYLVQGIPTLTSGAPTLAGGYLSWPGVPTLDGGYLPWPGGTYLGWGDLSWPGVPTLARGMPTLDGGYLPWSNVGTPSPQHNDYLILDGRYASCVSRWRTTLFNQFFRKKYPSLKYDGIY